MDPANHITIANIEPAAIGIARFDVIKYKITNIIIPDDMPIQLDGILFEID